MILVTGDWQAEFANLDTCNTVVEETLDLCSKYKIKHVVHVGDFKEHYNPVDVRVTNFAVSTCYKYRRAGIEFHCLLGNHDRVGMYTDTQNWLPALSSAGAHTYDVASGFIIDHEDARKKIWMQFLPFCSSAKKFRKYSNKLAAQLDGVKRDYALLFFHQELFGARFNVLAKSKEAPLSIEDLHPDKYLWCIGGHIEFMQQVKHSNVWYVGSPYAGDWGAANQRKGYMLCDVYDKTLKPLWSEIPRMYDTSWPNFEESRPKDWKGSLIRVHVPCDRAKDVQHIITKTEAKYEAKYKGARVIAVPEFPDDEQVSTKVKFEASDEDKVRQFVADTIPTELEDDETRLCEYIIYQLSRVSKSHRSAQELKFLWAKARNFLSFKRLNLNYRDKGLILVSGINRDWGGRSVGSGKTSLLQPIAVALAGRTFKNQKHNRWARRGSVKRAFVELGMQLADGRVCTVYRSRRPYKLKFKINGKDKSSGNKPGITQELIENTLGLTWQSLSNAIYIDQQLVNSLLTGTDGERKEILERIQNLERFAKAQDFVKSDLKTTQEFLETLEADEELLDHKIKMEQEHLDKEVETKFSDVEEEVYHIKRARSKLKHSIRKNTKSALEVAREMLEKYGERQMGLKARLGVVIDAKKKLQSLGHTCTMCFQKIDKNKVHRQLTIVNNRIAKLDHKLAVIKHKVVGAVKEFIKRKDQAEQAQKIKERLLQLDVEYKNCLTKFANLTEEKRKFKRRQNTILSMKRQRKLVKTSLKSARHDALFLQYCSELLSKYGLPAELNVQMCPILNRSAKFYSNLFTNDEIKVRFAVVEGEFKVDVMNTHGGETTADQSRGELRLASIITCFALRDTMKCNLLILDEPGEGLDDVSASKFGRGVGKLVAKFGTVMLATHNPYIVGSIKPDHYITVVKTNGISRIQHKSLAAN